MNEIIDIPEKVEKPLRTASAGARFGNYIADIISFYILLFLLAFLSGDLAISIDEDLLTVYIVLLYVLFYAVFESLLGKTPGKFLTRTHVVKADGSRPSFVNLLGRTLARFIPFEAFSFLFSDRGWHDSLSGTYVVYDDDRS
ncbi:MAG TPA: RDD family protein [Cyclobacteriaceae bacterium]|nr:RDD family protein [Cyclobacteriaceae bacterium]HMV08533.1 RDD family protein [Cyclobacteriaceae bacterium]HMV90021.1 RDD family protein [Cyclobacteriaceae bacterium]HMX01306.1 RDD family protein [Cyclobacteriaceae bacterium]HMX51280.1 RDD family protein [Cyclobacteriaceae bacterium]